EVITVPFTENRVKLIGRLVQKISQFTKKNRIDILDSHHRLANWAGYAVSKMRDMPHIITIPVFKHDFKLITKAWKNQYINVHSHALKKHLTDYYSINEKNIAVIHNSIKTEFEVDKRKKDKLEKAFFNDKNNIYITSLRRFTPEIGVDVLLESIPQVKAECPDAAFRIFGNGPDRKKLKKRCRELKLNPEHIFPGVNYNVNELLSLADTCVIPSRTENFSLFTLECMRAGKPIVATDVGGTSEAVVDGQTGLLAEAANPEQLAEKIITLCKNRNIAREYGRNGRRRFETAFPIKKFYDQYECRYKDVIKAQQHVKDEK